MKIFHKQLILLVILFGIIFGTSVYFYFRGLNQTVEKLSRESTLLLANQFKSKTATMLREFDSGGDWTDVQKASLREFFLDESNTYPQLDAFFVVDKDSQVVFSLNSIEQNGKLPVRSFPGQKNNGSKTNIKMVKNDNSEFYYAFWEIHSPNGLTGILRVDPAIMINEVRHNLTLKLYLIGFSGVLGVILISLIGARVLRSPMNEVAKAMVNIDKRKYGFRLKRKQEDEFSDVYEKVNLALRRLEQLDSVQRAAVQRKNSLLKELKTIARFLDIMAHEIKNPLHAFVINLDVLKTKIQKGRAKADSLKHVRILELEVEHLKEIINGFLRYVRPGVPQKERSKINNIIKDVCQMASAEAEKTKIKIETRLAKGLKDVFLDRSQFQQALHNIMINAIHATSEGGKILIRSWARRNKILVSVKDTGAGISKEELKKIYELYFTTKKEGTGIGLPISKRIIEANGGQMQLESKVGKGTTVTIILNSV